MPSKNLTNSNIPNSAYIHIPFCRSRCYYCDFPISVLGNKTNINTSQAIQDYVEFLCQEIQITPIFGDSLVTVFFGGGTPSLLPVKLLERTLATLERRFGIKADAEISMEIDPGTFTLEQLQGYRQAGVNRFSLGVQAFQDELLKVCGRSHSLDNTWQAINLIHQASISNFSLDLISGLPQQTLEQWQFSLETAIKIAPHHLSCYDLVLEPVTAFGKQYQPGENPLPTDEITAQMYRLAQQMLTQAGYHHYEISNYAQLGHQCRHNRVYWENRSYYGFGMGAASYTQGQRFTRPLTRKDYFTWVQKLKETAGVLDYSSNSEIDILLETLMLGFRLLEGINLSQLQETYTEDIIEEIYVCLQPYYNQGWVQYLSQENVVLDPTKADEKLTCERIRLTDPEGFLFSNTILSTLFERFLK